MNDVIIPDNIQEFARKAFLTPIIDVIDDQTAASATDNLKFAKVVKDAVEKDLQPLWERVYQPYKLFNDRKKILLDAIDDWVKKQKTILGKYQIELQKKLNEQRSEAYQLEKMQTQTVFAKSTARLKPAPVITDKLKFISTLLETGKPEWINAIFDKVNESQLRKFVEMNNLEKYPGLNIEMVADVKVR